MSFSQVLLVGLGQMQQQAVQELISEAMSLRGSSEALKLLHRIGVRLRQNAKLERLSKRDEELRKLLS